MPLDIEDLIIRDESLKGLCARISQLTLHSLLSVSILNEEQINDLKPLIDQTIFNAAALHELPAHELPENTFIALRLAALEAYKRLHKLSSYTSAAKAASTDKTLLFEKWKGERDSLLEEIDEYCTAFCNRAISVIPYLTLKERHLDSADDKIESLVTDFHARTEAAFDDLKFKQSELEGTLKTARDMAAHAGVATHAQKFGTTSDEHTAASKWWLVTAVVLLLTTITIALIILLRFPTQGELKDAATVQRIIGKAVAISILYFSALWSAKNYRTHRHLAVVNSHRQNALNSFDAFVHAAGGDDQTKNAVLLETTRCIFAPVNTGYLGTEDDPQGNRIIEIFKTVSASSGNK
jgi:hypothetical protein